ncbi:type II secretion system protein [Methylotenera sp.]|uniref:type IV pilin protein n=1 Tax=Methylotenera sp. TaxID=2051956 RepID=UPI0025EEFCEB|nr:type II secretion system protein [Methylotenera sp.]
MIGNTKTSFKLGFGFTLIELLVVMAVIAVLLTLALPKYFGSIEKSKEAALQQDLSVMRDSIDKYYGDTGKYPKSLEDLAIKHYLKVIPVDPITESAETWVTFPPAEVSKGNVYDVKSGSNLKSSTGKPYSEW